MLCIIQTPSNPSTIPSRIRCHHYTHTCTPLTMHPPPASAVARSSHQTAPCLFVATRRNLTSTHIHHSPALTIRPLSSLASPAPSASSRHSQRSHPCCQASLPFSSTPALIPPSPPNVHKLPHAACYTDPNRHIFLQPWGRVSLLTALCQSALCVHLDGATAVTAATTHACCAAAATTAQLCGCSPLPPLDPFTSPPTLL